MSNYMEPEIMELRSIIPLENHVKYSRPENAGESVKASLRTIKSMGAGN